MTSSGLRNPVLLIHGIWDTGIIFHSMRSHLTQRGWSVYDLDMKPNNGDSELEHLAAQVADYIDDTFVPGTQLDIVGYSMGGIVSRYYIQRMGGAQRVRRFITLSSPHNGTWVAYGSFRPGCIQMRPNSSFLEDLNRDMTALEQLNFTSIWTPLDTMIVPASSSQMPVGKNIKVWVPAHHYMVSDPRSLRVVATALTEPLKVRNYELTAARSPMAVNSR
ncbi:esterase/lipase family protein [Leptothermofonsia sp. ETS-13]|uniref:esterase/lipase family protein n=1 Tax=Leptothermofonsia sp. ETS-13 TaxID=3035696 RepID=UPI003B9EE07E